MEDVITDLPPPSRFFLEDLNNFTPATPPIPSPSLVFSSADSRKNFHPSLLIIAISSPSLHFLHHLTPKTLIGRLNLPEIPSSGSTAEPLLSDKTCNIYVLNSGDKLIMIVLVQFAVSSERSHAVAKLLIGGDIVPEKVVIFGCIQSSNFRGRLSPGETTAFKLETSLERRSSDDGDSPLIKSLDYFPSGSVVDGLAAALLSQCQLKKIKGTLCVSWPDLGAPVMSLVKSILAKDVLSGINYSVDGGYEDEYLRLSHRRSRISELYT